MKKILLSLLLVFGMVFSASAEKKSDKDNKKQEGIGTINTFVSHGKKVFRFMPEDKELRMVKFVPAQLGYGKELPKEMNDLLAKAMEEKLKVKLSVQYFDHGPKKPAIGKKVFSLTLADAK
ncbi:MAG: hypothetical protein NE328_08445 [Lentisphaeraceae bacterium]|nr:hypothetical protein [Lentisphaeraceae bacterium]